MARSRNKVVTESEGPEVGVQLTSEQARAQQEADGLEGEPAPVMLAVLKDDEGKPEDAPPVAVVAKGTPFPRFVHENERAPRGLKRFKVRAINYGDQPTRYVLAGARPDAESHYKRATGLDGLVASLGEEAPEVRLSVRELAD